MTITIKSWGAEGPPRPTSNWGDAVNPELVRLITGSNPKINFIEAIKKTNVDNYLVIGSILRFADSNTTVWGSGFLRGIEKCREKPKKILAVRGPLTRAKLIDQGIDCPKVFGDPALLFPKYYTPKVEKKYRLGIIPHWQDTGWHDVAKNIPTPHGVIKIRHDVGIYKFVDLVCSCERIASSSLHGLIVADAYRVPNVQIAFLNLQYSNIMIILDL